MSEMSVVASLVFAILMGACSSADRRMPFSDASELIATIESRIAMPEGAGPLTTYTRIYGRRGPYETPRQGYVYGLLERVSQSPRQARWSEEIRFAIGGGGCNVVTFRYNLATGRVENIRCNGPV